jgi:hypothetical protein
MSKKDARERATKPRKVLQDIRGEGQEPYVVAEVKIKWMSNQSVQVDGIPDDHRIAMDIVCAGARAVNNIFVEAAKKGEYPRTSIKRPSGKQVVAINKDKAQ